MKTFFYSSLMCFFCAFSVCIAEKSAFSYDKVHFFCGEPKKISSTGLPVEKMGNLKQATLFRNHVIDYHKPDMSQPFQQKMMNFLLEGQQSAHLGQYMLVTRNAIYKSGFYGAFEPTSPVIVEENCAVLVDEEFKTLLSCQNKSDGMENYYLFDNIEKNSEVAHFSSKGKIDYQQMPSNINKMLYIALRVFSNPLVEKERQTRTHKEYMIAFKNQVLAKDKNATPTFKENAFNHVLMAIENDWYGKYLLITKDKIFQTDETGVFDEKINPYAQNCTVFVDTEKTLKMECQKDENQDITVEFDFSGIVSMHVEYYDKKTAQPIENKGPQFIRFAQSAI